MFRQSIACLALAAGLSAQTIDRTKPPQTPPIPTYKLPSVFETKLPNGMGVILVEDARFPLTLLTHQADGETPGASPASTASAWQPLEEQP